MIREQIEIVINEEGEATIHVQGVKGKSCTSLTDDVEKALGKVKKRTETREAREAPVEARRCVKH